MPMQIGGNQPRAASDFNLKNTNTYNQVIPNVPKPLMTVPRESAPTKVPNYMK